MPECNATTVKNASGAPQNGKRAGSPSAAVPKPKRLRATQKWNLAVTRTFLCRLDQCVQNGCGTTMFDDETLVDIGDRLRQTHKALVQVDDVRTRLVNLQIMFDDRIDRTENCPFWTSTAPDGTRTPYFLVPGKLPPYHVIWQAVVENGLGLRANFERTWAQLQPAEGDVAKYDAEWERGAFDHWVKRPSTYGATKSLTGPTPTPTWSRAMTKDLLVRLNQLVLTGYREEMFDTNNLMNVAHQLNNLHGTSFSGAQMRQRIIDLQVLCDYCLPQGMHIGSGKNQATDSPRNVYWLFQGPDDNRTVRWTTNAPGSQSTSALYRLINGKLPPYRFLLEAIDVNELGLGPQFENAWLKHLPVDIAEGRAACDQEWECGAFDRWDDTPMADPTLEWAKESDGGSVQPDDDDLTPSTRSIATPEPRGRTLTRSPRSAQNQVVIRSISPSHDDSTFEHGALDHRVLEKAVLVCLTRMAQPPAESAITRAVQRLSQSDRFGDLTDHDKCLLWMSLADGGSADVVMGLDDDKMEMFARHRLAAPRAREATAAGAAADSNIPKFSCSSSGSPLCPSFPILPGSSDHFGIQHPTPWYRVPGRKQA